MRRFARGAALLAAGLVVLHRDPIPAFAQGLPGAASGHGASGAYTGLASSPEANLFTGAAQTSIPIEVPPGRLGLAPVLSLSYSSSGGPGPWGHGWDLALPRVHRSTRHGVPRYDDGDTFVLAMPGGAMELERVPGSRRGFRPKVESTFPRIGFDESTNHWKVMDKLGTTFFFGRSAATRVGNGASRDTTFAWLLESVEDPAGNRIDFAYRRRGDASTSTGIPERILYGANAGAGASHFAEVRFVWESIPYPAARRVVHREGHPSTLEVRIEAIETFTHGLAARRYDFSHDVDPVTGDDHLAGVTLTAHGARAGDDVRLPSTVFLYASPLPEGWGTSSAPPVEDLSFEIPDMGPLHRGDRSSTRGLLDLDGDSRVDVLDTQVEPPSVRLGEGTSFAAPRAWNWPRGDRAPTALRRSDGNGNLLSSVFDLDGDGFADLVDSDPHACAAAVGHWCMWRGSPDGFADDALAWASPAPELRGVRDGGAKVATDLLDVDADGRPDLVDATSWNRGDAAPSWSVHRNEGNGFAAAPSPFAAPRPWLSEQRGARTVTAMIDLNADGLPDFVDAGADDGTVRPVPDHTTAWKVHLHDGRGLSRVAIDWKIEGGRAKLPNYLGLAASDGSTLAEVLDVNGDGRPDLLRRNWGLDPQRTGIDAECTRTSRCLPDALEDPATSPAGCCFRMLLYPGTGASFGDPVSWTSPTHGLRSRLDQCPARDFDCRARWIYDFDLLDFDGDGLLDFVEHPGPTGTPGTWRITRHPASASAGRARPNLLRAMRNGIGGETALRYTVASAAPESRLPFPQWIVSETRRRDTVFDPPPLATSFAWRGAFFDADERESRGFAVVQETDPVGVLRVREYHQDRRRAGRLARLTVLEPPPCTAVDPMDPEDPCSPWRRPASITDYEWPEAGPVLLASETQVPFHDGSAVEALRTTATYLHDAYGNVTRRRTGSPLAVDSIVETTYVHRVADAGDGMPSTYSVSKPSRTVAVEDGKPSPLLERRFEYRWQGAPSGALTAARTCMAWQGPACTRWSARSFEHDRLGNVVSGRSPDGASTTTTYDANGLFPVALRDGDGVTSAVTDPRTGRTTETTTPGGVVLSSRYDGLGRLLATWGPGGSEDAPLRAASYSPGSLDGGIPRMRRFEAATGWSTTFFDGLGRTAGAKALATSGDRAVSRISSLRRYDVRGLVVAEATPFDSTSLDLDVLEEKDADAPAWITYAHDAMGRVVETRAPDRSTIRHHPGVPGIRRTDDANMNRPSQRGSVTLEFLDGHGRRLQRDVCSARPGDAAPFDCPQGALESRETWIHDALGRVTEARTHGLGVAAGDAVTRIEYDGLGNRTSVFHSEAGAWSYAYDDAGRLTDVRKPDGVTVSTRYDGEGRIQRRVGPDSRASWRYWSSGPGTGKVRRVAVRSEAGRISRDYDYDEHGRLAVRRSRMAVRGARPATFTVRYGYDRLDRRVRVEYPDWGVESQRVLETSFAATGQVDRVFTGEGPVIDRIERDSSGRSLRIDYGNGISDLVAFETPDDDARRAGYLRCTRTTSTRDAGTGACAHAGGDLDGLVYADYDPAGNLLRIDDPLHGPGDPLADSREYAWDDTGRLLRTTYADGSRERYGFDPLGNLIRRGDTTLEFADSEHPSRLSSISGLRAAPEPVEHDSTGRRVRRGSLAYAWDQDDRLVAVGRDGSDAVEYGYDETGTRVWAKDPATGIVRFEPGDGLVVEGSRWERAVSVDGRIVAVDVHHRRFGQEASAVRRFYLHLDHQHSVRTVTDALGRAVEHRRYGAFGDTRVRTNGAGASVDASVVRFAYSGHAEEAATGLLHFGARTYDPATASFLSLDPAMQFASPYAFSGGNPVIGRDADGRLFEWTALELLTVLTASATFIDSLVSTGNLGGSLTAGVFAGMSVYGTHQLTTLAARSLSGAGSPWMKMAVSVAGDGLQAMQSAQAIEDGRYAGGVLAAGMLAASLIGIETATDPGPGETPEEKSDRSGIVDRGVIDGRRTVDVNGICATRPGCFSNILVAARENLRVLLGGDVACVGGCENVVDVATPRDEDTGGVRLRCNSFGTLKCLGALRDEGLSRQLRRTLPNNQPALVVEMSGSPLLRPPGLPSTTYQVNAFDPVVWVGTAWSLPFRSDVVLGANWWVPAPVLVHHTRMYEKSFFEALGEIVP